MEIVMVYLIIFVTVQLDRENKSQNVFSIESGPYLNDQQAYEAGEKFKNKLETPYLSVTYSTLPKKNDSLKITT